MRKDIIVAHEAIINDMSKKWAPFFNEQWAERERKDFLEHAQDPTMGPDEYFIAMRTRIDKSMKWVKHRSEVALNPSSATVEDLNNFYTYFLPHEEQGTLYEEVLPAIKASFHAGVGCRHKIEKLVGEYRPLSDTASKALSSGDNCEQACRNAGLKRRELDAAILPVYIWIRSNTSIPPFMLEM